MSEQVPNHPEPIIGTRAERYWGRWPRMLRDRFFLGTKRKSGYEKHHESNLAWSPISIGSSIVLTVIAAMKHDLRFLLYAAWLCFVFGTWHLCKRIPYTALSRWIAIICSIVVAIGQLRLNLWLNPKPQKETCHDQTIATTEEIAREVWKRAPESAKTGGGTPTPITAKPELVLVAPNEYLYTFSWAPAIDMTPRITLAAKSDSPQFQLRNLSGSEIMSVDIDWVVPGAPIKNVFLGQF